MATGKKRSAGKHTKYVTADGHSYLTKRTMVTKARTAGKRAASRAMQIMGFVVVAENNAIVKKYADGTVEVIENIDPQLQDIALD